MLNANSVKNAISNIKHQEEIQKLPKVWCEQRKLMYKISSEEPSIKPNETPQFDKILNADKS